MAKILLSILFSILLTVNGWCATTYFKNLPNGGSANALDSVDGTGLSDGDRGVVISSTNTYFYKLDDDAGGSEDAISYTLITPDTNAGTKRWVLETIIYDLTYTTLANDATPSVANENRFLTGGTTMITDFDDGITGQIIVVVAEHSITITDGTNIFLNSSGNFVMAATDSLTLICKSDNKWYEIARSDN